jgi:hypothetical protein
MDCLYNIYHEQTYLCMKIKTYTNTHDELITQTFCLHSETIVT